LIATIPSADKSLRIVDGANHDLLHEPAGRGDQLEDSIIAWLDAHTGGPAVAATAPYAGHLTGDPKGWLQAIEIGGGIGARQEAGSPVTGAFDFDAAVGLPRPVGWFADVSARITPDLSSLAVRPIGIGVHDGALALGVDGGVSLLSGQHGAWSVSARAEAPLGFAHFGVAAEWDRWFSGSDANRTIGSDGLWLGGALRFGGDRSYWPHAHAGVGPTLFGGLDWGEQGRGWFLLAGLELFGAD
jgi:hypothetical protein